MATVVAVHEEIRQATFFLRRRNDKPATPAQKTRVRKFQSAKRLRVRLSIDWHLARNLW
jgi:hypothetical protein